MNVLQTGNYKNLAATANVKSSAGNLLGMLCATTSSGTVILYDSATTTTSKPITGTITLAAGTYYPIPAGFSDGLYAVIANTANITLFYV